MSDYISLEAALQAVCADCSKKMQKLCEAEAPCRKFRQVQTVSAAEVRPVVRGEWIGEDLTCSKCNRSLSELTDAWSYFGTGIEDVTFCPFCGADMRGETNV